MRAFHHLLAMGVLATSVFGESGSGFEIPEIKGDAAAVFSEIAGRFEEGKALPEFRNLTPGTRVVVRGVPAGNPPFELEYGEHLYVIQVRPEGDEPFYTLFFALSERYSDRDLLALLNTSTDAGERPLVLKFVARGLPSLDPKSEQGESLKP